MIHLSLKSMKHIFLPALLLSPYFASAAPAFDKDGVPVVDIHGKIVRPPTSKPSRYGITQEGTRMIDVQGKQIPLKEFLLTYCQGKIGNDTCARGSKIQRIDSSDGPVETLPKGL